MNTGRLVRTCGYSPLKLARGLELKGEMGYSLSRTKSKCHIVL